MKKFFENQKIPNLKLGISKNTDFYMTEKQFVYLKKSLSLIKKEFDFDILLKDFPNIRFCGKLYNLLGLVKSKNYTQKEFKEMFSDLVVIEFDLVAKCFYKKIIPFQEGDLKIRDNNKCHIFAYQHERHYKEAIYRIFKWQVTRVISNYFLHELERRKEILGEVRSAKGY